jgi:hypothetical protein
MPDIDHVRRCGVVGADKLPAYDPDGHFSFERKVLDTWIGVSYGQLGAVDQVEPWPANGFWNYGDRLYDGVGNNNEEMHALVYLQQHLRTGNWACAEYGITAEAVAEAARVLAPKGRLLIVDFAPHEREELRARDAHARLGFADDAMLEWLAAAGLKGRVLEHLGGGELTVTIWQGEQPQGKRLKVVA